MRIPQGKEMTLGEYYLTIVKIEEEAERQRALAFTQRANCIYLNSALITGMIIKKPGANHFIRITGFKPGTKFGETKPCLIVKGHVLTKAMKLRKDNASGAIYVYDDSDYEIVPGDEYP